MYYVPVRLLDGALDLDLKQIVSSEGDFYWRGLSHDGNMGDVLFRFSINDRYYLSNRRVPLSMYAGQGQDGRAYTPEWVIPAGGKIGIEAENNTGGTVNGGLLLLGVERRATR
jgi:hypothetical protein